LDALLLDEHALTDTTTAKAAATPRRLREPDRQNVVDAHPQAMPMSAIL